MQVGILTNLNSRKNRSQPGRGARLQRVLGDDGLVRQTRQLDEIRPVLEEFIDRGVRYWVSDGGDGTLHWMLNEGREVLERRGLMRDGTLPLLVPTNGGTIDFVARKAGITGNADAVIDSLVDGLRRGRDFPTVEIDSLEVLGHRPGDAPGRPSFRKIGFAVAVGGIGQRFFRLYYQEQRPGPWAIIRVTLKGISGFVLSLPGLARLPLVPAGLRDYGRYLLSGTRAHVVADGRVFGEELYQGLHAGAVNIDFGTVKLFRYAQQPGKLHLVVGAMNQLECTYKWVAIVLGVPVPGKRWHEFPGQWMEIEARGEPLAPIIDGEVFEGFDWLRVQLGPKVKVPLVTRH